MLQLQYSYTATKFIAQTLTLELEKRIRYTLPCLKKALSVPFNLQLLHWCCSVAVYKTGFKLGLTIWTVCLAVWTENQDSSFKLPLRNENFIYYWIRAFTQFFHKRKFKSFQMYNEKWHMKREEKDTITECPCFAQLQMFSIHVQKKITPFIRLHVIT